MQPSAFSPNGVSRNVAAGHHGSRRRESGGGQLSFPIQGGAGARGVLQAPATGKSPAPGDAGRRGSAGRDGVPPLEEIIDAFAAPFLREFLGTPFTALIGRVYAEPGDLVLRVLGEEMREIARRFGAALRRALPVLSDLDLFWRMHFAIGALAHTLAGTRLLEIVSQGRCRLATPRTFASGW